MHALLLTAGHYNFNRKFYLQLASVGYDHDNIIFMLTKNLSHGGLTYIMSFTRRMEVIRYIYLSLYLFDILFSCYGINI